MLMILKDAAWNQDPEILEKMIESLNYFPNAGERWVTISGSQSETERYSPSEIIKGLRQGSSLGRRYYDANVGLYRKSKG